LIISYCSINTLFRKIAIKRGLESPFNRSFVLCVFDSEFKSRYVGIKLRGLFDLILVNKDCKNEIITVDLYL